MLTDPNGPGRTCCSRSSGRSAGGPTQKRRARKPGSGARDASAAARTPGSMGTDMKWSSASWKQTLLWVACGNDGDRTRNGLLVTTQCKSGRGGVEAEMGREQGACILLEGAGA